MLFRETLADPLLTKYSLIMIDEAHGISVPLTQIERTIYTELIMGLLKKIITKRPDLRIIISRFISESSNHQRYSRRPEFPRFLQRE
jgi:ATP-dependent RNA helicase DDX35